MIKPKISGSFVVFCVGIIVWVATSAYLKRPFPGDSGDDGQYLVTARSLYDQKGYRLISRHDEPVATKYPLGVPAITAAVMNLIPGEPTFERDYVAGRIVVITAGLLFVVASRRLLLLCGLPPWPASLLALAVIWYPFVIKHLASTLMSDLPYAALSTFMVVRWIRRSRTGSNSALESMVDGVIAGLGWLLRANGLTLVIAALVAAMTRTKSKWLGLALVLVGVACLNVPASLYYHSLAGPRDTDQYLSEQIAAYSAADHWWSLPVNNLLRIPNLLLSAVVAPVQWTGVVIAFLSRWTILRWIGCAGAMGLLACGVDRLIRQKIWPSPVWTQIGLTLAIYIFWHFPIDHRFLLPLAPLALVACAVGMEVVVNRKAVTVSFCAASLAGSILVMGGVVWRARPYHGLMRDVNSPFITDYIDAIKNKTSEESIIVSINPELVYLNSSRRVISALGMIVPRYPGSPLDRGPQDWSRLAEKFDLYVVTGGLEGPNEEAVGRFCADSRLRLTPICLSSGGYLCKMKSLSQSEP